MHKILVSKSQMMTIWKRERVICDRNMLSAAHSIFLDEAECC